jgi:hypothetical protein
LFNSMKELSHWAQSAKFRREKNLPFGMV